MTKTYTTSEKSWLRATGRGMWIGSEFGDHGRWMRIVSIGVAYRPAGENRNLIDVEAIEIPPPTPKAKEARKRR